MTQVVNLPTPEGRSLMERLVFNGIVFNMSWEDPEMDRRALRVGPGDSVISITSAGCNPLNFLCQNPDRLISIDGNPAQNAILELKLAAIETLDYETFFDIFAARRPAAIDAVYRPHLRKLISIRSQDFWDQNLWMLHHGLYDFGKMGVAARIVRFLLPLIGISKRRMEDFFECRTLEEQTAIYHQYIAPKLWGPVVKWLCESRWFMYLCGVHPRQLDLVDGRHGIYDYVRERIEYALTKVPAYDNYFLSVTATGRFRDKRVPPYLLEENFLPLRERLDRVTVVNGWLGPYLDSLPAGSLNKFNLLYIFDWMTPELFESTLASVLRAAAPNSRLIYRSGSYEMPPPDSIRKQLDYHEDLARECFAIDRSATYGSFYVFSTKSQNGQSR